MPEFDVKYVEKVTRRLQRMFDEMPPGNITELMSAVTDFLAFMVAAHTYKDSKDSGEGCAIVHDLDCMVNEVVEALPERAKVHYQHIIDSEPDYIRN